MKKNMKLNRGQLKRAAALVGVLTTLCFVVRDSNDANQRFLSNESPIAVSAGIDLKSDAPKKYGLKKYGSLLPESYREHNYCELDNTSGNEQCKLIMGQSALRSKPHWHFFGDSQMATTFKMFLKQYPFEISVQRGAIRTKDRGMLMKYLNVEMKDVWIKPDAKLFQGPVHYGLGNPFSSDMNGWGPMMVGDGKRSIEFLNVEFAQDVELQTPTTSTTQETAALYLKN